jgi:hypothetical protein
MILSKEDGEELNDSLDTMLDMAWWRLNEWYSEKNSINTNTSIILTLDGVLVALLYDNEMFKIDVGIGALLALSASAFLSMLILFGTTFKSIGISESLEQFKTKFYSSSDLKLNLLSSLGGIERRNRKKIGTQWKLHNASIVLLAIAFTCIIWVTLS